MVFRGVRRHTVIHSVPSPSCTMQGKHSPVITQKGSSQRYNFEKCQLKAHPDTRSGPWTGPGREECDTGQASHRQRKPSRRQDLFFSKPLNSHPNSSTRPPCDGVLSAAELPDPGIYGDIEPDRLAAPDGHGCRQLPAPADSLVMDIDHVGSRL